MRRAATPEEIARWDELIAANPDGGNVLQTRVFAEVKAGAGWLPRYEVYDLSWGKLAVVYLTKRVFGIGELWYAPKGPGVVSPEQLRDVVEANLDAPAFLIKMEPEIIQPELKLKSLFGLVKAPRDIQYNTSTVIVDLKPNEDEILASLKQKTRYNVRLAEKKGVQVEAVEATETNFRKMYELMQATQKRAGFYLRDYAYFHDFWMRHAEAKRGQLFFASFEGKILAGDFVTYAGTKGLYKDGGSIREHSELQAPYLLQWEVIRWLKAQGVTEYDLHGTPPADQIDNPSHPLAGLARFKTGFNPVITEFVGVWDQPLDAAKYAKWNKYGERVAAGYARRVKKELFY